MNSKIRFNWIAAIMAAFALSMSAMAAQQVTANENTTNKVSSSRASASHDSKSKKTNINTASKMDLEKLPGVGPAVADNIIAARPFKTVSDLKSVNGIGEKRFEELLPYVTVGSTATRRSSTSAGGPAGPSSAGESGSDKPSAKAQSKNVIPSGSYSGAGGGVTTDTVHSGSDKPGAREKEETRSNPSSTRTEKSSSTRNNSARVNLNTASKEQLEALPGIGPVKAQAIIDNRPYSKPEDVMKVSGIKEGTYDKIRDQITVR
jgi:competence protein ComEA